MEDRQNPEPEAEMDLIKAQADRPITSIQLSQLEAKSDRNSFTPTEADVVAAKLTIKESHLEDHNDSSHGTSIQPQVPTAIHSDGSTKARRKTMEIIQLRNDILMLLNQGFTQESAAQELDITRSNLRYHLEQIKQDMRFEADLAFQESQARQRAALDTYDGLITRCTGILDNTKDEKIALASISIIAALTEKSIEAFKKIGNRSYFDKEIINKLTRLEKRATSKDGDHS